jgi:hypothetical protein
MLTIRVTSFDISVVLAGGFVSLGELTTGEAYSVGDSPMILGIVLDLVITFVGLLAGIGDTVDD